MPPPDALAFQTHVRRVRHRRAGARAVVAAAAVAAVAVGAALMPRSTPASDVPAVARPAAAAVPLLVDGRLRMLAADGSLGPTGPAVATLVGSTPSGVVVFRADGSLARVSDGAATTLVDEPVRTAYVDGDAVVYQTFDGRIRWLGGDGPSAQTDDGRLMAAGENSFVVASDDGVVLHDAAGEQRLDLDGITIVRRVEVGGGTVAVSNDLGTWLFVDGRRRELPGALPGALSPDGGTWVTTEPLRAVDTATGTTLPVDGPTGRVDDVRWVGADLLVVTDGDTLWRCPGARACEVALSGAGSLRLR